MADQLPSFEQALESDIHQLAQEIQRHREQPELRSANEKELVKEALRSFPVLPNAVAPAAAAAPSDDAAKSVLPDYAANAPAEVKLEIEYLLDIALKKGIGPALDAARKSPYFVQDAFHDSLAGKLYPELQRRGVVK